METIQVEQIPLGKLTPSPNNPRRFRDDDPSLAELAASIKNVGVIQPIAVRPKGKGFEIIAGERRFRASRAAGLESIPATVRELTDEQALEITVTENLQRADLSPLEEARGYDQLMRLGREVGQVADRVGRSIKYVYDRVKLLALTKEAQALLEEGRITAGHAILLARLQPSEQERVIKKGLFTHERLLWDPAEDRTSGTALSHDEKPVSVRELQAHIDQHVRFDHTQADPMLFPTTVAITAAAAEEDVKVIQITHEHYVQEDARDKSGARIFGPRSWKRADGEAKSKTCDKSIVGVIVAGPGRGDSFRVCIAKKTCKTHWAKEQAQSARDAKAREKGADATGKADWQVRQERERAAQERRRDRWTKALPKILEALAERVKKAPANKASSFIATLLLEIVRPSDWTLKNLGISSQQVALVPEGAGAEALLRRAAWLTILQHANWHNDESLIKWAKALGVDVKKILAAEASEAVQASAPAKASGAAAAKKPKAKAKRSRKAA